MFDVECSNFMVICKMLIDVILLEYDSLTFFILFLL